LLEPSLEWLATMCEEEFRQRFRRSAIKRTKWKGLVRNACIALGNASIIPGSELHIRVVRLLAKLMESDEAAIASSARWAMSRIQRTTT
jgi:epoxyqueuosine reductase